MQMAFTPALFLLTLKRALDSMSDNFLSSGSMYEAPHHAIVAASNLTFGNGAIVFPSLRRVWGPCLVVCWVRPHALTLSHNCPFLPLMFAWVARHRRGDERDAYAGRYRRGL